MLVFVKGLPFYCAHLCIVVRVFAAPGHLWIVTEFAPKLDLESWLRRSSNDPNDSHFIEWSLRLKVRLFCVVFDGMRFV